MRHALAASIMDALPGFELGTGAQGATNRLSLEGVTAAARADGVLEFGIASVEAAALRLAAGPLLVEVGRLALRHARGQLRRQAGRLRLSLLEAEGAELSGVTVHGRVTPEKSTHGPGGAAASAATAAGQPAAGPWCLGPLATADGRIRAQIVDAQLLFDADVTVTVGQGVVDFNKATVAHVGPDSRMGVSRLGIYVDAPNGRSYLYQFASTTIAGVEYERRGAMLGPWVTDRGRLQLQAFVEGLLRQGRCRVGLGFTEQSRLLLHRTAVSGEVRLGDGRCAVPGAQAELVGRAEGRNAVRLHSEAVGRGLAIDMPSVAVRRAVLDHGDAQLGCEEVAGSLTLRLFVENGQLRFALGLPGITISGLRLGLHAGGRE